MSFWAIVLISLIGAPMGAMLGVMLAIFGGTSHGSENYPVRTYTVIIGGLGGALALASAFGAFGVGPAWRAWHGGAENFDGCLASFVHWLVGLGFIAVMWFAQASLEQWVRGDMAKGGKPTATLWWAMTGVNMVCFGALIAWLAWPLVLWPIHGHFEWPDAMTGWLHTAAISAGLLCLPLVELGVRKARGALKR